MAIEPTAVLGGIGDEDEELDLIEANEWVASQGLPRGDMPYEIVDQDNGAVNALLDLAWPEGIQTRFSEPVALLLNEEVATLEFASAAGFRCFTDVPTFRAYVENAILALDASAAD